MKHVLKPLAQIVLLGGAVHALMAFNPPRGELIDVTVGVLSYGTAQWEMKVIKDNKLDEENGINLIIQDLGSEQAGDVGLQAGDLDVILTDYVWVSIQRNQGNMITAVPHSLAVGGVITGSDSGIESLEDLAGKTIGVAGGPVDKSWIILQAYYTQQTGESLVDSVEARFAAPPLTNELLGTGELDAALNFWHWNARAKAAGMDELISVADMLEGLGISDQAPLLTWAFTDETAAEKEDGMIGFLNASFDAKDLLLEDDEVWESLRELMGATDDDARFEQLKADYRAGIVTSYDPADTAAAEATFALLSEYGGAEAVGDVPELADGTFWAQYSR